MISLKLTPKRLREHWRYNAWKYVVFTLLALFGANFLFTATTPQIPYEKRVDVMVVSEYINSETATAWETELLAALPSDQQKVTFVTTPMMPGQEMTIMQVLIARMSTSEGTIWILPDSLYRSLAQGDTFVDLTDKLSLFQLPEGTNPERATTMVGGDEQTAGVNKICGIPLDQAGGLYSLILPKGMVMCFPVFSEKNWDNAVTAANWMFTRPPPAELSPEALVPSPQATATAK